jgi:hypothetical protein
MGKKTKARKGKSKGRKVKRRHAASMPLSLLF